MNDSNVDQQSGEAVTSDAVRYNIEKKDEKTYTLTVTADPQWLQAPERKYPVYVDPSIELIILKMLTLQVRIQLSIIQGKTLGFRSKCLYVKS